MKGIFISFEGIEGTGKSTQAKLLAEYLGKEGFRVIQSEEPGGTHISLMIRKILLSTESKGIDPLTELLLYNASRVQHLKEVIFPALQRGDIVITDRFSDSTIAYQGHGRGIDLGLIDSLDNISTGRTRPDVTLLLDIDVKKGLRRNREVHKKDRIELEDISFHEKVRRGFLSIASREPDRVKLIDCSDSIGRVHDRVAEIVRTFLETRRL